MSNDITNGIDVLQSPSGQVVARVGESGELLLPMTPGGFTALGLRPGATVYISLSPPGQAYGAVGQTPIIILNNDSTKAGGKKPEKKSEVFKRL